MDDQETDTGLSSSSYPVPELSISSQSPTLQSEEDRKWLLEERILEGIQEFLATVRNSVQEEQRKQLLVEAQLRAEVEAVQKLLSKGFSLKRTLVQAPVIQFSREPEFKLFVSGNVSTLRGIDISVIPVQSEPNSEISKSSKLETKNLTESELSENEVSFTRDEEKKFPKRDEMRKEEMRLSCL